jgi:cholesterol transport system auxiliary component
MRRRGRRTILALGAAALLAGCALPAPEAPATLSLIDQWPADLPRGQAGASTLLVLAPQARPAYDTTRMAYRLRPHHIAYYARNEWAETPPQMLQPLLVRTLEATGRFQAVLAPPHAGASTYRVEVELLELLQDYSAQPPLLRLVLHVQLTDASRRTLASRELALQQPLPEQTPAGGVRAANAAMAQALRDVAGFVLQHAR